EELQQRQPGKVFTIAGESVMVHEPLGSSIHIDIIRAGLHAQDVLSILSSKLSHDGSFTTSIGDSTHLSLTPNFRRSDNRYSRIQDVYDTCETLAQKYPDAQALEQQQKV